MCTYLQVNPICLAPSAASAMPSIRFEASKTGAEEGHGSIVIPSGDKLSLVLEGLRLMEASCVLLELGVRGDGVDSLESVLAQSASVVVPILQENLHQLVGGEVIVCEEVIWDGFLLQGDQVNEVQYCG